MAASYGHSGLRVNRRKKTIFGFLTFTNSEMNSVVVYTFVVLLISLNFVENLALDALDASRKVQEQDTARLININRDSPNNPQNINRASRYSENNLPNGIKVHYPPEANVNGMEQKKLDGPAAGEKMNVGSENMKIRNQGQDHERMEGMAIGSKQSNLQVQGREIEPRIDIARNLGQANPQINRQDRNPNVPNPKSDKIADMPECFEEVRMYCSQSRNLRNNNFAVMDCLQQERRPTKLSRVCNHFLWEYKKNNTEDKRFLNAAQGMCSDLLASNRECAAVEGLQGHLISCLMEKVDNTTSGKCRQFLTKMEAIVFSDYRLVYNFVSDCSQDIKNRLCGRVLSEDDQPSHSQAAVIECLSKEPEKIEELTQGCRKQILRIAELQAEDFHLDRPLFYACRDDREKFCERVTAGNGRVYKCLMKHKSHEDMSAECQQQLLRRQQMVVQDYRVSHSLVQSCKQDMRNHGCRAPTNVGYQGTNSRRMRLSTILLCLEGAIHDERHPPVSQECRVEMLEWRKQMMDDYKVNPEIVVGCDLEIRRFCSATDKRGETMHCLMELAMKENQDQVGRRAISDTCYNAIGSVLREADVGSNVMVDPIIVSACLPAINTLCGSVHNQDSQVLSCLMENIDKPEVPKECERRLLELNYFVSRDFSLDSRLYHFCKNDATRLCSAPQNWHKEDSNFTPEMGHLVFHCLYTRAYRLEDNVPAPREERPTELCMHEIKRVMHQRAISVHLMPEIEQECLHDLSEHCSGETGEGQELRCLQEKYDSLSEKCQDEVEKFTEIESQDAELDRLLMKACSPTLKQFCQNKMGEEEEDDGALMECLIEHKDTDMDPKCRSGIEHYQLITLKNYKFSFVFRESCKEDIRDHCPSKRTKVDVVECLSGKVTEAILRNEKHEISNKCRQQLRVELFQRTQDVKLNPKLKESCSEDIELHCADVPGGRGRVMNCLREHRQELTRRCQSVVFHQDKELFAMPNADYVLMTNCKEMIKKYCHDTEPKYVLNCLIHHKSEIRKQSGTGCARVIVQRQIEQNTDYRLNPRLQTACRNDIPKFCKKEILNASENTDLEGIVIECLKNSLIRKKSLTRSCEEEVKDIMEEAQDDIRQDPVLLKACNVVIKKYCSEEMQRVNDESIEGDHGEVEQCLKNLLQQNKLNSNRACKDEVRRLVFESRTDIHVDPILFRACKYDLQVNCMKEFVGNGNQLQCILAVLDSKQVSLKADCVQQLQSRRELWNYVGADADTPQNMQELIAKVQASPARNYFMIVVGVTLSIIFIGGLFCGRVTKRVAREIKNK